MTEINFKGESQTYIESLFTPYGEDISLTEEREATLIALAQHGDVDAKDTLTKAYRRALVSAEKRFMRRYPVEERTADRIEEVRMEALAALYEAIKEHDAEKSPRLAGTVKHIIDRRLADAAAQEAPMTIPERTLSRFYGILRKADGDIEEAAALAPEMGMRLSTFNDIRAVVRETLSLTLEDDEGDDEGDRMLMHPLHTEVKTQFDEAEDNILIDVAFRAVDDEEARIIELSYGFRGTEDYAPGEVVPDGVIATLVGGSRPTVQRKRNKALGKMRESLGVTLD